MTTPTNENRDTDRPAVDGPDTSRVDGIARIDGIAGIDPDAPQTRNRLDLSVTKVAAGACAAAIAAAVGSKLGVGGTIIGAAVASAVATSASAVIGHSLERGKTAARKAMPVALTAHDEAHLRPSLADRAVTAPHTPPIALPEATADAPRTWKDRIPGRKPLIAAGLASFLIGTGAVTALEVARKGEFPGYHSNVFTDDPGQGSGSDNHPPQENPGGGTHSSAPSPKPDSPSPTPSGSGSSSPSSIPSTPSDSGSTPSTPSTGSSGGSSAPSTTAPTGPADGTNPTTPGPSGSMAPSGSAGGPGKVTPSGGPTG
jgi:hypothetical protein